MCLFTGLLLWHCQFSWMSGCGPSFGSDQSNAQLSECLAKHTHLSRQYWMVPLLAHSDRGQCHVVAIQNCRLSFLLQSAHAEAQCSHEQSWDKHGQFRSSAPCRSPLLKWNSESVKRKMTAVVARRRTKEERKLELLGSWILKTGVQRKTWVAWLDLEDRLAKGNTFVHPFIMSKWCRTMMSKWKWFLSFDGRWRIQLIL